MEYLLKHSPIKIKEFLTADYQLSLSADDTMGSSTQLSRNGSRGYVIQIRFGDRKLWPITYGESGRKTRRERGRDSGQKVVGKGESGR